MTQALIFNEITLSPVTYQNSLWIRATELARALGYSDTRKITHLYERNADEFTPEMTQVIEIADVPEMGTLENLRRKARIFSLRGCHLVAMFARTPVAKAFRRWVLDVLDKLDAEQHAAPSSPTPDDFTGTAVHHRRPQAPAGPGGLVGAGFRPALRRLLEPAQGSLPAHQYQRLATGMDTGRYCLGPEAY